VTAASLWSFYFVMATSILCIQKNKESYMKDQNRVLSHWTDLPQASGTFRLHATQFNICSVLGTIDPPTSSPINYGNFPCGWSNKHAQLFLLQKNLRQQL